MEKLWPEAIKVPGFLDYIPDEWTGTRVDRCYFWGILCTLATDYVTKLVEDCQDQRNENKRLREVPKDNIQPQEEWLDRLLDVDFIPSGKYLPAFFIFALQGTRRASACSSRGRRRRQRTRSRRRGPQISIPRGSTSPSS